MPDRRLDLLDLERLAGDLVEPFGRQKVLGAQQRQELPFETFERTWARAGSWAFVVLPPGRLATSADEAQTTNALVAFEKTALYIFSIIHVNHEMERISLVCQQLQSMHCRPFTTDAVYCRIRCLSRNTVRIV